MSIPSSLPPPPLLSGCPCHMLGTRQSHKYYSFTCKGISFSLFPSCFVLSFPLVPPHPILPPPSDLEYGLPVQVRDQALGVKDNLPQSDVGREYYLQNMEKEVGHVMVAMVTIVLSCGIVSTAKDV